MNRLLCLFVSAALIGVSAYSSSAAEPVSSAKPKLKITPGKVIVPTDAMRRIWGELVSVDLETRAGTFRNEGTDEVMPFKVMPYAELLHHATFGDLNDYRIGERAIFRMHENEAGAWVWLTYIQDEMNFLNGHGEYYHVDEIDAAGGKLTITQANADKSFVRTKGIVLETDGETHFWKDGAPAKFADIKIGDKLRTKTHGVGKGKSRVCWEVFLDEASLLKFQAEQKAVHAQRLAELGAPGYVDTVTGSSIELTMFQEGGVVFRTWKVGRKIRIAPAGSNRQATGEPIAGTIAANKPAGNLGKLTVTLDGSADALKVGGVARVWAAP